MTSSNNIAQELLAQLKKEIVDKEKAIEETADRLKELKIDVEILKNKRDTAEKFLKAENFIPEKAEQVRTRKSGRRNHYSRPIIDVVAEVFLANPDTVLPMKFIVKEVQKVLTKASSRTINSTVVNMMKTHNIERHSTANYIWKAGA